MSLKQALEKTGPWAVALLPPWEPQVRWLQGGQSSSQGLTLSLYPVLQKRNRAITARRQHLKVRVGCYRGLGV